MPQQSEAWCMQWFAPKPYIAYVVGVINRFMSNLGKELWATIKWILRYLRGTLDMVQVTPCQKGSWTPTYRLILTPAGPCPDMWWLIQGESLLDSQGCKRLWLCQPQKRSIWVSLKPVRKWYGWNISSMSWEWGRNNSDCTMTIKVSSILLRMSPTTRELNISNRDTIGLERW